MTDTAATATATTATELAVADNTATDEIKVVLSAATLDTSAIVAEAKELAYTTLPTAVDRIRMLKRCVEDVLLDDNFVTDALSEATKTLLRDSLNSKLARLEDLLWGKTLVYEGPLHDGYQRNEYKALSVMIGSWLMESYPVISKVASAEKEEFKALFSSNKLSIFAKSFLIATFRHKLVHVGEDWIGRLSKDLTSNITSALFGRVEGLVEMYDGALGECCSIWRDTMKRSLAVVETFTERRGAISTELNALGAVGTLQVV